MKRSTKLIALMMVLTLVIGIFAGCSSPAKTTEPAADAPKTDAPAKVEQFFVNIGTGGTAGTYFPLGGAFAEIWNNTIPGINATAQSTGASVANINLLEDGKIEVAIVQNDVAMYAHDGKIMFDGKAYDKLRGLATLYSEPLQIITTDPSIKSIADLKGKKIAVGSIGSGVEANARQIIAAAGMDFDKDIKAKFLSFSEAAASLKDKQIDAAFLTAGIPTAAIQDLGAQNTVTVVPIGEELSKTLKEKYKFFTDFIIPANTYKGQSEDIHTLTVKSMLVVSSDMDDELAYNLVKAIYDNHDRVVAAHNVGKYITVDSALDGMSVPVHPGAAKFFDESK
ncbi:TAXI family TRAP transporter solute-binding subunit [Helicovermis profundi]|uniref:TAXI family TRAP transporter solute-binding subunit n=1 Tax=Helicovermis profundi TaxID=3065157 RepID=A0AAU9EHU4_9FIRM|nr:TAXI family TRAP transporter solute-binding subunit [Clostridia bacterium S502]